MDKGWSITQKSWWPGAGVVSAESEVHLRLSFWDASFFAHLGQTRKDESHQEKDKVVRKLREKGHLHLASCLLCWKSVSEESHKETLQRTAHSPALHAFMRETGSNLEDGIMKQYTAFTSCLAF